MEQHVAISFDNGSANITLADIVISADCKIEQLWWQKQREPGKPQDFSSTLLFSNPDDFTVIQDQYLSREVSGSIFGFDCEYGDNGTSIALIQIATWNGVTMVCHIARWGFIPKALRNFLEDATMLKVGVACENDVKRIKKQFRVRLRGWLDVRYVAKGHPHFVDAQQDGLKAMARQFFGLHLDETQRRSDWTDFRLTSQQIAYAAADAQVALDVFLHSAPIVLEFWPASTICSIDDTPDILVAAAAKGPITKYKYEVPLGANQLIFQEDAYAASELIRLECEYLRMVNEVYIASVVEEPTLKVPHHGRNKRVSFDGRPEIEDDDPFAMQKLIDEFMAGGDEPDLENE